MRSPWLGPPHQVSATPSQDRHGPKDDILSDKLTSPARMDSLGPFLAG
jgi:hypothetical protein